MIKQIKGNKLIELTKKDLLNNVAEYNEIIIDIGTGDGRFIYKQAQKNPTKFYIGIDPSQKQLEIYSKKANKKRLNNILFIWTPVEQLPSELQNLAKSIYIILPWGTLLQHLIIPNTKVLKNIAKLFDKNTKTKNNLEIVLGYSSQTEPTETQRLQLPQINQQQLKNNLIKELESLNFTLVELKELQKEELNTLNSSWSKKLSYGSDRPIYSIKFSY